MLVFVVSCLTRGTQLVCAACKFINTFPALAGTSGTGDTLDLTILPGTT